MAKNFYPDGGMWYDPKKVPPSSTASVSKETMEQNRLSVGPDVVPRKPKVTVERHFMPQNIIKRAKRKIMRMGKKIMNWYD